MKMTMFTAIIMIVIVIGAAAVVADESQSEI